MTVIQPNKIKSVLAIIIGLSLVLFLVAFVNIYVYSKTVSLKYDASKLEKNLESLRVENAELKNDLYQLVDLKKLENLAKEKGMIQDKNPQWAFASRF